MATLLLVIALLMSNTVIACGVSYFLGRNGWGRDLVVERCFGSFFLWPALLALVLVHKSGASGALDGASETRMLKEELMDAKKQLAEAKLKLEDIRALPPRTGTYR